ncbi:hypothetical protein SAMN02745857_01253 [Andreprevotia lacus DSM 23236]|jgi:hypothetical protein|uniref:Uncharacterized protein n=1 Tax=Andreprevotia lacus DSM 23236 TaxID=1121001 RepID=A0A1W1XD65_9NEIS|nr:hypothetical protein [Andreprevotia lacus]SMC21833.1 hypothetical protein SAMN02745857_01253 [Andreprevotia lacus DSM 23236]
MIRIAMCLVFAATMTHAWAEDAPAAKGGVDPLVSQCYEKLQQRVPKRTNYTAISASDAQLQAATVANWDKPFSNRINKKVATKVSFEGEVSRKGKDAQTQVFHCGYSKNKIETWEVRSPKA